MPIPQTSPASLEGTLNGMDAQSQADAMAQALAEHLAQQSQQAYQASDQAGQQYQQAAQAPPPDLSALDAFIPQLFSNVASVIGRNPTYAENAQQNTRAQRAELLKARADNLSALRDNFRVKAEAAQKAGDLETELTSRAKVEQLSKTLGQVNDSIKHGYTMEEIRAKNEGTAKAAASKATSDTMELSPSGVDMAAYNYRQTGQLPPLGMKAGAMRKQIIERAAALPEDYVPGVNLPANRANYRADTGSMAALQRSSDALNAFERTGLKNLDLVLTKAKSIPDTGAAWTNRPLRNLNLRGMGSTEVAAFKAAQSVAAPEIARILNNPNLGGQLTDSARHEAESVLASDYTFNQLVAVSETLKQDFANRKQSYVDQMAEIKGRLSPTKKTEATGNLIPVRGPNNKVYYFPTQEKADLFKKRMQ